MSVKKISIHNASLFAPSGHFGKIAIFRPGVLKLSDLPIQVTIHDPKTNEEFPSSLVSVVHFSNDVIPDILSRIYEGKPAEESAEEILARCKVQHINQLGFYLYVRQF